MDSGTKSLSELTADNLFRLPRYQRFYSWNTKQLEDLWIDLENLEEGKDHYFGAMILQETDEIEETEGAVSNTYNVYQLVDGQQRLATIGILLREMISRMETVCSELEESGELEQDEIDDIKRKIGEIRKKYLNDKNVYMIQLQEGDKRFYKRHIIDGVGEPREQITPSQELLWEAKKYFEEKFDNLIEESASLEDFLQECNVLEKKIDNLEVMTYPIPEGEEERATLIFESVNARGRNLSDLDKTKSFLMHLVYLSASEEKGNLERSLNTIKESFSRIYEHIQKIKDNEYGDIKEDDIQEYHYIGFANWTQKEYQNLLENLKNTIRHKYHENNGKCLKYILSYTRSLEEGFQNLKEILKGSHGSKIKELINRIHFLRHEAKFYPMLISIWSQFKDQEEELKEILRAIEKFCFRIYAIGNHPRFTAREKLYRLTRNFYDEEKSAEEWKFALFDMVKGYEDDSAFRTTLRSTNFYNQPASKDIRYLLYFYEKWLQEEVGEEVPINLPEIMSRDYEVEHIWPQTPSEELSAEERDVYEENVHKLGNLTMSSRGWHQQHGNDPFQDKKEHYADSSFRVERRLQEYDEWNEDTIRERENRIIDFVLEYWNL